MNRELENAEDVSYKRHIVIVQTAFFRDWLNSLRDRKARLRIDDRLKRLASGNAGDSKSVGGNVRELRFHFGPGYRVYYMWRGETLIVLLSGGDKGSQARDIAKARELAEDAEDGIEGLSV